MEKFIKYQFCDGSTQIWDWCLLWRGFVSLQRMEQKSGKFEILKSGKHFTRFKSEVLVKTGFGSCNEVVNLTRKTAGCPLCPRRFLQAPGRPFCNRLQEHPWHPLQRLGLDHIASMLDRSEPALGLCGDDLGTAGQWTATDIPAQYFPRHPRASQVFSSRLKHQPDPGTGWSVHLAPGCPQTHLCKLLQQSGRVGRQLPTAL